MVKWQHWQRLQPLPTEAATLQARFKLHQSINDGSCSKFCPSASVGPVMLAHCSHCGGDAALHLLRCRAKQPSPAEALLCALRNVRCVVSLLLLRTTSDAAPQGRNRAELVAACEGLLHLFGGLPVPVAPRHKGASADGARAADAAAKLRVACQVCCRPVLWALKGHTCTPAVTNCKLLNGLNLELSKQITWLRCNQSTRLRCNHATPWQQRGKVPHTSRRRLP